MSKPAAVAFRACLGVHQDGLNPSFPAVQGTPIKIASYRAEIFSIQVHLERQAIFALFLPGRSYLSSKPGIALDA